MENGAAGGTRNDPARKKRRDKSDNKLTSESSSYGYQNTPKTENRHRDGEKEHRLSVHVTACSSTDKSRNKSTRQLYSPSGPSSLAVHGTNKEALAKGERTYKRNSRTCDVSASSAGNGNYLGDGKPKIDKVGKHDNPKDHAKTSGEKTDVDHEVCNHQMESCISQGQQIDQSLVGSFSARQVAYKIDSDQECMSQTENRNNATERPSSGTFVDKNLTSTELSASTFSSRMESNKCTIKFTGVDKGRLLDHKKFGQVKKEDEKSQRISKPRNKHVTEEETQLASCTDYLPSQPNETNTTIETTENHNTSFLTQGVDRLPSNRQTKKDDHEKFKTVHCTLLRQPKQHPQHHAQGEEGGNESNKSQRHGEQSDARPKEYTCRQETGPGIRAQLTNENDKPEDRLLNRDPADKIKLLVYLTKTAFGSEGKPKPEAVWLNVAKADMLRIRFVIEKEKLFRQLNAELSCFSSKITLMAKPELVFRMFVDSDVCNKSEIEPVIEKIFEKLTNQLVVTSVDSEQKSLLSKNAMCGGTVSLYEEKFIVFERRYERVVMQFIEVDRKDISESVQLPAILHKFQHKIKERAKEHCVMCIVEKSLPREMHTVFYLTGSRPDVSTVLGYLEGLSTSIISQSVNVNVTNFPRIAKLDIEHDIEHDIDEKISDLDCVVSLRDQVIMVYGFELTNIKKACSLIDGQIVEANVHVKGEDLAGVSAVIKEKIPGKVAIHFDSLLGCIYVVGMKDHAHLAMTVIKDLLSTQNDLLVNEKETRAPSLQPTQEQPDMDPEIRKSVDVTDKNVEEFLLKADGEKFIYCLENMYSVSIKVTGLQQHEVIKETNGDKVCHWTFPSRRKLVLDNKHISHSKADAILMFGLAENTEKRYEKTKKNNSIIVKALLPDASVSDSRNRLIAVFHKMLQKAYEDRYQTLAVQADQIGHWDLSDFHRHLIETVAHFVSDQDIPKPKIVTLCTKDNFQAANDTIESVIQNFKSEIKINVVKGFLDKIEADVIVNTTSTQLDLSQGAVSNALLKAAGQKLQHECDRKYPSGIRHDEIAVTHGYKLKCQNVLHLSLEKYEKEKDMEKLKNIEVLMHKCLEFASSQGYSTVAFPAFGTGILKYPADVVAGQMFCSVPKFKLQMPTSSLKEVLFVIYPQNKPTLTIFKEIEKDFRKHALQKKKEDSLTKAYVEVSGKQSQVDLAVADLHEKIIDVQPDIEEKLQTLTVAELVVFRKLHDETINSWKYCKTRVDPDCKVYVQGKACVVRERRSTLMQWLNEVKSMARICLQIQLSESLEKELNSLSGVLCVRDYITRLTYTFANSQDELKKVQQILRKYGHKLFETDAKSKKCDEAMEDQSVNRPDTDESKGTSNLRMTFSWCKHTKNQEVFRIGKLQIRVYEGNILNLPVDAIVNAANKDLKHEGGVASKIAKAGGQDVKDESRNIVQQKGTLPVTSVVQTSGGKLPYRCIYHAVGPMWSSYNTAELGGVEQCTKDLMETLLCCFKKADEDEMRSVAMASISAGIFGVPKELCAVQYAKSLLRVGSSLTRLQEIHFVDIKPEIVKCIQRVFASMINNKEKPPYNSSDFVTVGTLSRRQKLNKGANKVQQNESEHLDFNTEQVYPKCSHVQNDFVVAYVKDVKVIVHRGDIWNIHGVDGIVCPEVSKEDISSHLEELCGSSYVKEKNKRLKERVKNNVIVTSGGRSTYKAVLHAIVPDQADELLALYKTVFKACQTQGLQTIAMPFLATHLHIDENASALLKAWTHFIEGVRLSKFIMFITVPDTETSEMFEVIFTSQINNRVMTYRDENQSIREVKNSESEEPAASGVKEIMDDSNTEADDDCVICMDAISDDATALRCGHKFCRHCIEQYFKKAKPVCPTCGKVCGTIYGDMPDGMMEISKLNSALAGYQKYETIVFQYLFAGGIQKEEHPSPGKYYRGISRIAYLPDSEDGRRICAMLIVAFERRLTFTIGASRTTGEEGVITWNDIHHKTDTRPGTEFGYPDPTYLDRVTEELAAKGVTDHDIKKKIHQALKKTANEFKPIRFDVPKSKLK